MGGEARNEGSCPPIGPFQWVVPPSHLRLYSSRMEHYIQTHGYAMAPEALAIRDNDSKNMAVKESGH